MNTIGISQPGWLRKGANFVLFFIMESPVFAIITLSPYLPQKVLLGFHSGLTAALLIIALFLRRSGNGKQYWPVFYTFFVAGAAVLICASSMCLRRNGMIWNDEIN